jgi:hypothetical protein
MVAETWMIVDGDGLWVGRYASKNSVEGIGMEMSLEKL